MRDDTRKDTKSTGVKTSSDEAPLLESVEGWVRPTTRMQKDLWLARPKSRSNGSQLHHHLQRVPLMMEVDAIRNMHVTTC